MGMGEGDMGLPTMLPKIGRWALRDKDGALVEAMATPQLYPSTAKIDFGVYEFSCANISFWSTDYIGMAFELATGKPAPCYNNLQSWKDAAGYFKDANCTQPVFFNLKGFPGISIQQVSGQFWYGSANNASYIGALFAWNPDQKTCTEQAPLMNYAYFDYKAVPAWVLDTMNNPPYTLTLEY